MSQASESIAPPAATGKDDDTTLGAALKDAAARRATRTAAARPAGKPATPVPQDGKKRNGELPPLTLRMAREVCPTSAKADQVATRYGLDLPCLETIADATRDALLAQRKALGEHLGEKALDMLFQRVAGAYVGAAFGAGTFYAAKVDEVRRMVARQQAERAEDRDAFEADGRTYSYSGLPTRLDRAQDFAAEMCMQAYATLAMAEGACEAYGAIAGKAWMPYDGRQKGRPGLDQQARQLRTEAFD